MNDFSYFLLFDLDVIIVKKKKFCNKKVEVNKVRDLK